jgi:hypothetical protein
MQKPDEISRLLASGLGPALFRLAWWNHLDPSRRDRFRFDLVEVVVDGALRAAEHDLGKTAGPLEAMEFKHVARMMFDQAFNNLDIVPKFADDTFEKFAERIVAERNVSKFGEVFAGQFDDFTSRTSKLSPSLIKTVPIITEELVIWLKTHPADAERLHSDAFEQLTGEILTSRGFAVEFTGRIKNKSADMFAIKQKVTAEKWLVECKRYSGEKKVDLNILNAVIGSSFRAKTDHAMLVTTSSFTRNVLQVHAELEDFRLDLCDGKRVNEWLAGYKFKENLGLWLPTGWQDQWTEEKS